MAKEKEKFIETVANLQASGKWAEELNMDRFVILVFLTAEEKRAFALKQLGDENIDYFDGDDVERITIKPTATKRKT